MVLSSHNLDHGGRATRRGAAIHFRERDIMPKDHGIGASPKRRGGLRFLLTENGNYTGMNITFYGTKLCAFLRSDVAHGG